MPPAAITAPTDMPTTRVASGSKGTAMRSKPNAPSLSMTPARRTLPAVGASTCAAGNHVCKGITGTLIPKPTARAKKAQYCSSRGSRVPLEDKLSKSLMLKVSALPVTPENPYATATMPIRDNRLPASVFFCLAGLGLPGLNGFVSELLTIYGRYGAGPSQASQSKSAGG